MYYVNQQVRQDYPVPYIRPQIRTYLHQTIIANYYQTVPELKKSECCCMFNRSIPIHVHSGFLNTKSI